jgi:hypothetical protein
MASSVTVTSNAAPKLAMALQKRSALPAHLARRDRVRYPYTHG